MADPCTAEHMLNAILIAMLRKGALDPDIITEAADDLDGDGHDDAAHQLRCAILEAEAPSQSDWEAGRARARFRVVESKPE